MFGSHTREAMGFLLLGICFPQKTVLNESVYGTKSCLDQQEMAYAQSLIEGNTALIEGSTKPNFVEKFSKAAASSNDSVSSLLVSLIYLLIWTNHVFDLVSLSFVLFRNITSFVNTKQHISTIKILFDF